MPQEPLMLGNRYRLESIIGRGGMAEVWRATDTRLDREVAVKRLRVDLATDPTFQARFRKEAQSAAGLNHPNIVAVYDTGEEADPTSGIGVPYIVMELVEGHTLRDLLQDGRKIQPTKALEFTAGVLDALSYSHKMGIVHRDIKPANVMLTRTGVVKVMDFGIARAVADTSATMTQTAAVIGTAQYLSPEQARGETVDNRSDIYSTGCLLYELLTGRPPFQGDSPVSVAYQHVRETPAAPSSLDQEITTPMDAITLKALAKDPVQRYQTAAEMRDDITRLLAGDRVQARIPQTPIAHEFDAPTQVLTPTPAIVTTPQRAMIQPMMQPAADTAVGLPTSPEKKKRLSGGVIALLVLGVLLLATVGYGIWKFTRPTPSDLVSVPALSGQNELQAKATLEAAGLNLGKVKQTNGPDDLTIGMIIDQDPGPQKMVDKGSSVDIVINQGPAKGKVPDVVGRQMEEALQTLKDSGFTNVKTVEASPKDEPIDAKEGQVIAISPDVGTDQRPDVPITITYATGYSLVPNLLGKDEAEATRVAQEAGFTIEVSKAETSQARENRVFEQDLTDGTKALRPGPIKVKIAVAPPTPTVTPTPKPKVTPPTDQPDDPNHPGTNPPSNQPPGGGEEPEQ